MRIASGDEADLVEAIYDSTAQRTLWPMLLDRIAQAANGNVICLFDFDPGRQRLRRALVNHLPDAAAYHAHYAVLDPRNRYGVRQPAGSMFIDAAFISSREIARSEFYQDYLIANDMGHVGALVLEHSGQAIAGLAVQRSIRQPAFDPAELGVFVQLAPHLRRALRLQRDLDRQGIERGSWSHACLDSLVWPVLLLDEQGRLLFASMRAEALLHAGDGVRSSRGRITAWHPWDARCLEQAITRGLAGSGAQLPLRRAEGGSLLVSVVPLGRSALEMLGTSRPRVAIHLLDPRPATTFALQDQLASWFQLSPAEARLAVALLGGESLSDVAERLGLAQSTIKTQLARLFSKTETSRQSELVALLQRGAVLPTFPDK